MQEGPAQTWRQTALEGVPPTLSNAASSWLARLPDDFAAGLEDADTDGSRLADTLRVAVGSEFASAIIEQRTVWFQNACRSGVLDAALDPAEIAARCDEVLQTNSRGDFMRELRMLRNEMLLRILWRDWVTRVPVRETLRSLSDFAERAIVSAVQYAQREQRDRYGDVRVAGLESPLVVLAMGKLGGRELNFSSDVDLVFVYPEEAETDGRKSISAHEYFTRVARSAVGLLEEMTADGFVYRVDTRLRPFGDSGPLVQSFAAFENYLVEHGRSWERYAYIKARVIHPVDQQELVAPLVEQVIEPFVYRKYLDFGVFAALREMHELVATEVRRHDMRDNVKLGPGGIREIEFIVQALQLVRGGSLGSLRTSQIYDALVHAVDNRDLTEDTAHELRDAYELLRRVENALQARRDQQTHDLPKDEGERARLAFALSLPAWTDLDEALRAARGSVAERFAAVAVRQAASPAEDDSAAQLRTLWARRAPRGEWGAALRAHGLDDAEAVATVVREFSELPVMRRLDASSAKRLEKVLPELLLILAGDAAPATTLRRITPLLLSILRRSAYLALLHENPAALTRLVELCSRSEYLANELATFPMLFDELLDPTVYKQAPTAEELRAELAQRRVPAVNTDSESQVEMLAEFKRAMQFRVAVADLCGDLPVMKVSDRLTDIAELVLSEAVQLAQREMAVKFGRPRYRLAGRHRTASLGIVAYGKLGGIELSYGSDLDLVFLHDSRGTEQQTDGAKSIDNSVFFSRLARRLVHFLTTQTGSGALYSIDTRLRPSGRSGLLVSTIDAFERYQRQDAWTWEHQALLRARAVAGSSIVAREFDRIRSSVLRRQTLENLPADVDRMREKMRKTLDSSTDAEFHVKQGRGGVADIEFLVQYWVLANAADHPALIHYTDNIRQLGTLVAAGCLRRETGERLQEIYRRYRAAIHHRALDGLPARVADSEFAKERAYVADLWGRVFGRGE